MVYNSKILDYDDIRYLNTFYKSLQGAAYLRYFNLFSIFRKDIPKNSQDDRWLSIKNKIDREGAGECIVHYFLWYTEGSFTMLHQDSPHRVTKTCITLVDKSDNLIGGDIILMGPPKVIKGKICAPSDQEIIEKKEPVPLLKDVKSIRVVPQEIGDSVWYPAQTKHGVSEVQQGHRLVLISWYKNK